MGEKRIAVLNAHNTLNYGSMMLCENIIHYLTKMLPQVHFVVLSNHIDETTSRLKLATGRENIEVRQWGITTRLSKSIPPDMLPVVDNVLFRYRNLVKITDDCSAVIALGGDDISECYGTLRLVDILLRFWFLKSSGRKLYLLGQTIGPFHSWRRMFAKRVLQRANKIYHRGPISYNYVINQLKIKGNSFLSQDLGLLDLALQNGEFDIGKYDLKRQKYIIFVPSGFWSSYCYDYRTYFEGLLNITRFLSEECKKRSMKIVLLPHVLRTSDDRTLVKRIIAEGIKNENVVGITDVLLPYEARAILGSSYFVVTQRMHGAISSLQKGVPSLSLSYSEKFSEVIGSRLGLPELVVEIRKAHYRNDIDKASSAIAWGLQNVMELKTKIEKAVRKAKMDAMIQIEDTAKDIIS